MAERIAVLISTLFVLAVLLACGTRKEKPDDPPPPAVSVATTALVVPSTMPSASAVPSASIATRPLPKPATRTIPKCAGDDRLYALDEKSPPFCASDDSCTSNADCKGAGTCVDAIVLDDDGSPALTHNGAPMGGKICKRGAAPAAKSKCRAGEALVYGNGHAELCVLLCKTDSDCAGAGPCLEAEDTQGREIKDCAGTQHAPLP